jgi:hypothetical protein
MAPRRADSILVECVRLIAPPMSVSSLDTVDEAPTMWSFLRTRSAECCRQNRSVADRCGNPHESRGHVQHPLPLGVAFAWWSIVFDAPFRCTLVRSSRCRPACDGLVEAPLGKTRASTSQTKGWRTMASGLVASIIAFAVGAILDFAVTTNTEQHGFNIHTVGVILMVVGVVGAVLSLIGMLGTNLRRHRTVINDGRGTVVTRQDSSF